MTGKSRSLYGCRSCGRVSHLADTARRPAALRCPRCDTPLHSRDPTSLQRTWAYTVAAMLLYLPANLLPIMSTRSVTGTTRHTLLGGIHDLWISGDWPLALIVFVASMAVPILKIIVLLLLAITAQRRSTWCSLERARLYRAVEAVGHWSMLDVFVVVLLVGMIRFGPFAGVEAEAGLLAFGGVVVLTILAAASFDPRLLWPEPRRASSVSASVQTDLPPNAHE
jgi:paraquat-inducible protein A